MTSKSRETVKIVLERALEIPTEERPGFVARACAEDDFHRKEVMGIATHGAGHGPWPEGPILESTPRNGTKLLDRRRIGPYRIERLLGEGGMGSVALAVREDDFEKKVALKVIQGRRISEEMVQRFHNERQILAHLEHPNIARILDGGTTDDGLPYFVMEYVEGEPIDRYCEQKELSVRQRLELFLRVCSALQRAHQSLVVHRDLKPGNILVTGEGVPKLLDFGIAKEIGLEESGDITGSGHGPMTLKYASPEQVAGEAITIGTDVYSLGVLLFELLSGGYPYAVDRGDARKLGAAILEGTPSTPSAVASDPARRRRLAGDLDSIVLKAMHPDPEQRYGSVEQLAQDIRWHFEWRPVAAREATWGYRLGKLVRRHRRPLAAVAAVVILSVVAALTVTVFWRVAVGERAQAVRAREEAVLAREEAVLARGRSERVLEFMKELFRSSDPDEARGKELTAVEVLERGEIKIEEGLDDPLVQAELLATIGGIYTDLGLFDRAWAPRERAVYLLERAFPEGHPELAKAINNLAGWAYRVGEYERAEQLYRRALEMKQRFLLDEEVDIGKSMSNLASILMNRGAYEEAETLYQRSLEVHRDLYQSDHEAIAITLRSLGTLYYTRGELDRAEPAMQESLEMRQRLFDPGDTKIATAVASLGRLRHTQGRHSEAEALLSRALEMRLSRFGDDHLHVASSRLDLARLYLNMDSEKWVEGEALLKRSMKTFLNKQDPNAWQIAEAESLLGGYLTLAGRYEEAEKYLVRSLERLTSARGERSRYVLEAGDRLRKLYETWGRPRPAAESGVVSE